MSNIYIQEPLTDGKVLLNTTVGDIDIELWSKEAPKACRNFIQLCMEGYYDGTIFHRVVKGFIVQGGDPTGTGTGGESIYGYPFKDEFHSRLRFVRRGLVAMANSGKDDNESQFFFTLGATPELQNKHTIFGKVTGNTLYNILKFEEGLVDQDDRPIYPHKIISCKVLSNPFPDIVPRIKVKEEKQPEKPKEKVKKNFKLLSFGEEAEEDEAEMDAASEVYKGQSKSSHDLIDDPKLSSVPAIDLSNENAAPQTLENIRKKFENTASKKVEPPKIDTKEEENEEMDDHRKEIQRQIKELKKELRKKPSEKSVVNKEEIIEEPKEEENNVLSNYHKTLEKYKNNSKLIPQKGTSEREKQILQKLKKTNSEVEITNNSISESASNVHKNVQQTPKASWPKIHLSKNSSTLQCQKHHQTKRKRAASQMKDFERETLNTQKEICKQIQLLRESVSVKQQDMAAIIVITLLESINKKLENLDKKMDENNKLLALILNQMTYRKI